MRIVSALGLTLVHLFLQAQQPDPGVQKPVPATPVVQAQPGPNDASLDQYKVNYKRFTRGREKPVQDEAAGRLEWFRKRMGGDLKPEFTHRLLDQAARERATYPSQFSSPGAVELPRAAAGTNWVSLGPTRSDFTMNGELRLTKVDSGRLRVILPDTTDGTGNTVYVLATGGGLWKTTTFQSAKPSWSALTDFVGSSMSGGVAFGASTSTLYVGAGDPFDPGVGGFIIKSTDGGRSWAKAIPLQLAPEPLSPVGKQATKVMDIKVDTSQSPEVVLVGTDVGLFRSGDGGASFNPVSTLGGMVWSIVKTNKGWLASMVDAEGKGSVWLGTEGGAKWEATKFPVGSGRTTLAVGRPGDSTVYAFAAVEGTEPKKQNDLFRSTTGGTDWDPLYINKLQATNTTPSLLESKEQSDMNLMHEQAFFNQMILVDPSDAKGNTVYLGGSLYSAKTVDGGKSWTLTSQWLGQYGLPYVHADFHCAAYSDFNGKPRIYFGTDGGLFISDDAGAHWDDSKNEGLVNHLIYTLAANPGVAGSALVGLQDNGTRIRSGTTSTFNQIAGGDGCGVGWAQAVLGSQAVSMASYIYNEIYRSTTSPITKGSEMAGFVMGLGLTGSGDSAATSDNGKSYYFVTPIITPPPGADKSGSIFFTYGNDKTGLNAGPNSGKIFACNETQWTAIGTPGEGGITAGRAVSAVSHGLGVSPLDLRRIAAAGKDGCLLLTENGGNSWKEIELGYIKVTLLGSEYVSGVVPGWKGFTANIAWANNDLLYICSESTEAQATRVASSSNGGGTWVKADSGLPRVPVTKLAVDLGDATGNTVYAATWLGVYRTTNGGSSWALFGTGLPQCRVTDIWVAPDSSVVRVSTWGRGVWELQTPVTGPAVTSFNPILGDAGVPVTLTGTAFTGVSAVRFNGTPALFNLSSDTSISTVVPAGATTGNITVTTSAGTGTSTSFFTVTVSGPAITSCNPISGAVGTPVTLIGTAFLGATTLKFNGTAATFTVGSDTVISTVVPAGATTGNITVTSPAGTGTTPSPFTVALVGPAITSFNPTSGLARSAVTLTGTGFTGTTAVKFNGTPATFSVLSDTAISTSVPAGATSGILTVTTPVGSATSASAYTIKTRDLNGDGIIDVLDLATLVRAFGAVSSSSHWNPAADLTGDGVVDDLDLALFLAGM